MAIYHSWLIPAIGMARAGVLVNYAGALVSLALIIGVSIWGYKLVVRDVSGIPVVRAMAGDMRILPVTPGGEVTDHTGLSVNEVAGLGEAAELNDSVSLAPMKAGLSDEDIEAQPLAEENGILDPNSVVEPVVKMRVLLNSTQVGSAALSTNEVFALAEQIAAKAALQEPLPTNEILKSDININENTAIAILGQNIPGVFVSLRPVLRPTLVYQEVAPVIPAFALPSDEPLVTTAPFAIGTNLVQLGAFPNADVAALDWIRLNRLFESVMDGKIRVIQAAISGGKTFYRLRAQGFVELGDARRFCATLIAEGTDCIPVVVR